MIKLEQLKEKKLSRNLREKVDLQINLNRLLNIQKSEIYKYGKTIIIFLLQLFLFFLV